MSMTISGSTNINVPAVAKQAGRQQKTQSGFAGQVLKCVQAGGQKVLLCQDALMSYASPQTGESVNIYRSKNYSADNPVYLLKGLDKDGREFEQEIHAQEIDPHNCSYNELMVLNLETGHTSPADYLHAVAARDKAGIQSFFQDKDFAACIRAVMSDHRQMGSWDSYLSYDKWLQKILDYARGK